MIRSWMNWTATALFTLAAAGAVAAEPKPFAEVLPESTSVFLSIRNLPEVLRWHETSDFKNLIKDPDMQPFLKKLSESFDSLMAEMRKETGFTLADIKEVCTGEVAVALGEPADFVTVMEKGGDGPVLLLADVRGKKDQVRELLKKALEKTTVRKREIEFRGQTIIALEPREEEKEKAQPDPTVYLLHADDLLALSLSRPFLQDTLANREQADVKPLSQVAEFKDLREKYGKDAAVFIYAHSGRWIDKIPALAKANDADSPEVAKVFEAFERA